jgi:hypothetical protein
MTNIALHLKNILKTNELAENATPENFEAVQEEGKINKLLIAAFSVPAFRFYGYLYTDGVPNTPPAVTIKVSGSHFSVNTFSAACCRKNASISCVYNVLCCNCRNLNNN